MFNDLYPLVFLFLGFWGLRIICEMGVIHRRLRISLGKKLFGVSLFSSSITWILVGLSIQYIPVESMTILILNILLIGGVEAPLYQLFYPKKSWQKLFMNLVIARLLFSLVVLLFAIIGAKVLV